MAREEKAVDIHLLKLLKQGWDRPRRDRVRDLLASRTERRAIEKAGGLPGPLLAALQLDRNAESYYARNLPGYRELVGPEQWARWMARPPAGPTPDTNHVAFYAALRRRADHALREAGAGSGPSEGEVGRVVSEALASGLFTAPPGLPEIDEPSDGLGTPEGLRFLGETRGTKLPDGSRGRPCPLFLAPDYSLWVRNKRGEIQGYSGLPVPEVLGTRAKEPAGV